MSQRLSVVIPVYNEGENIGPLLIKLTKSLEELAWEVIVVDDGSTDHSYQAASDFAIHEPRVKILRHRRNKGKTATIKTGLKHAQGNLIAIIDADLQYDPADIPKLLKPILKGEADAVNGWRVKRRDSNTRILASKVYNWLVRKFFGLSVHDNNSGLKVFRREALEEVIPILRRDFHRYILPLLHYHGYEVAEIPVTHYPRKSGKSKYLSTKRLFTGFFDLITLKFLLVFQEKPIALFALPGFFFTTSSIALALYLLSIKLSGGALTPRLPLLLLTVVLFTSGIVLLFTGFLAELIASMREELREKS